MSSDVVGEGSTRDWLAWHQSYDDVGSSLSRRLAVVRQRIGETLDHAPETSPVRILSLCCGDGRDIIAELAARSSLRTSSTLIEIDERLVANARRAAAGLEGVQVRRGDAGDVEMFVDLLPVDLLLLCGIFGHITSADIRRTVATVPSMLAAGGTVIWTRGWFGGEDLRPAIRGWFIDAGLREVAFDGAPEPFGVGVARKSAPSATTRQQLPGRLFHFIQ